MSEKLAGVQLVLADGSKVDAGKWKRFFYWIGEQRKANDDDI